MGFAFLSVVCFFSSSKLFRAAMNTTTHPWTAVSPQRFFDVRRVDEAERRCCVLPRLRQSCALLSLTALLSRLHAYPVYLIGFPELARLSRYT